MSDPTFVTPTQLRAAYDALGLDPELFWSTRTIHLEPHEVTPIRYVLNGDGGRWLLDHNGDPVTWSLDIPVGDTDPTDMTAMLHESLGDGQQLLAALAEPDETHDCGGSRTCHDCGMTA
jgi:hypothetical protein